MTDNTKAMRATEGWLGFALGRTLDIEEYRVAKLVQAANNTDQQAKTVVDDHIEKLQSDPSYALQWSQNTFAVVAKQRVFDIARALVLTGYSQERVLLEARRRLMENARAPRFSTSVASNLLDQYTVAAWAQVVELLETVE